MDAANSILIIAYLFCMQADPMLYVRSIASLLDWFRTHTAQQCSSDAWQMAPPLVINTHGWIKVRLVLFCA